ncbi:MAG: maltose/maltodextrin ABC transporter substrate-binding protein MalE [Desulfobacteraceae bacterium]|jgi:maltose/maltodextrin transport system substrate-binding protein
MKRNVIKKRVILTICIFSAFFLLPQSISAAQDETLFVWINGDKGYNGLQAVGDLFPEDTGISVKVEYPDRATEKFQQAASAGKGPDIWIWPHDRLGEWVDGGLLDSVEPSPQTIDSIFDHAWDAFKMKGKIWGYPMSLESIALIYNKNILTKPPKSFESIFELDQELKAKGIKTILWDYNNTYFTWALLAANGGYVFGKNPDGSLNPKDVGVDNEGALKGATMVVDLIRKGIMPKGATYSVMESSFNQGRLAMMITGPWAWANIKKNNIDFGVAMIPTVNNQACKPFVGVLGAMINHSSKNKELAKEFIENYMLTLKGLKLIDADKPLGVPANKAFFEELKKKEHINATMENIKAGEPMPSIPEMGSFWSAMETALTNITSGRQSTEQALKAASKRIKQ